MIIEAYTEIGYASYEFDLGPEEMQTGLRRLDAMVAEWNGSGIRIGYPLPDSPQYSDIDAPTGVPDSANSAIYTNLGLALAPTVGKAVSADTRNRAHDGYSTLLRKAAMPEEQQLPPTMPRGAGNKPWVYDRPFVGPPCQRIDAGPDSEIDNY